MSECVRGKRKVLVGIVGVWKGGLLIRGVRMGVIGKERQRKGMISGARYS